MKLTLLITSAFATLAVAGPVKDPTDSLALKDSSTGTSTVPSLLVGRPVAPTTAANATDTEESSDDASTGVELEARAAASPVSNLYWTAAVARHNIHRANHGAGPVKWDNALGAAALKSAKRCTFAHFMNENGLTYGQNLALGLPAPSIAAIITDQWYSEVSAYSKNYGIAQPNYGTNMANFEQWGHFTQVVWKDTTRIGCATWRCNSVATSSSDSTPLSKAYGGDVTYCNYGTPGNYAGEYAANVGRPKSNAKIADNYLVNTAAIARGYSKNTGQKW